MEIEVGEYGRTNKGKIFIFAWLENSDGKRYTNKVLLGNGKIFENKFYYFDDGEEIVKHSKNIIDLVETGDLIKTNEEKTIIHIYDIDVLEAVKEDIEEGHFKIESIVTHEMFESIEYKVEENKNEK